MPLIDYREVRRNVPLRRVLEILGFTRLREVRGTFRGYCPLGCAFRPNSATFDFGRNIWFCHRCKAGGNQLDLFMRVRELTLYEAAVCLCISAGQPVPWIVGADNPPKLLMSQDEEWPP